MKIENLSFKGLATVIIILLFIAKILTIIADFINCFFLKTYINKIVYLLAIIETLTTIDAQAINKKYFYDC